MSDAERVDPCVSDFLGTILVLFGKAPPLRDTDGGRGDV